MLMKRIGITNNGCGVAHLVAGHFNLRVSGYCAVTSEMRASEFAENVVKFTSSHPHVFIADLDDEYENGEIELVEVTEAIKYGTESLVDAYTPGQGEIIWDTTRKSLTVGDGETVGGVDIVGMSIVSDLVIESEVTNFPAASTSQFYKIADDSDAGWMGGAAGVGLYVNRGDLLYCNKTTAAGTYAQVGQYWNHLRHIISQPDGYRAVEMLTNTVAPTIVNGFYWLNDEMYKVEDSVATAVGTGGGSGDVSTDAIWDAAGDLAVGTGPDTAGRLAIGTEGQVLTVVATTLSWATQSSVGLAASISDGDTTHAPDGNSVFDALSGKENHHGVQAIGAISFDSSGHVFSVASTTYWWQGTIFTTAVPVTCDLDLTADRDHASASLTTNTLYYFYFKDATGKLYWSPVFWNLKTMVPVATVFWNGSAGAISKESHGHTRNIDWHIWSHLTVGARYGSGLDKTYPSTSVDESLQIETGTLYDEDLIVTTGQQTTMRAYYKTNSTTWTFADFSFPFTGSAGSPTYLDTDTYTLTTFASNRYACYWVFATTDIDKPIAVIPSHVSASYSQITTARTELQPTVSGINPEWKLIYRFIFAGDGQFQESSDYRLQTSLAGAVSSSTTAGAVSFAPSGSIISTTVQGAIEELDSPIYRGVVFDGGGLPIVAGKKAFFRVPSTGTIVGAYAMADVSGSIEIAVWKDTFANFPPTVADVISASAPITLSAAQTVEDLTLTGWTKTVTAGDVICLNVNALATSITWVSAGLIIQ